MEEKLKGETRVKDLIAQYEQLMKTHENMCLSTKEVIGQKDVEIELLNDSIATLNTQVSNHLENLRIVFRGRLRF